jgi:peptidoglycan-associated lipoprotein
MSHWQVVLRKERLSLGIFILIKDSVMQYSFSRIVLLCCLGGVLAACGSSPKKDDDAGKTPPPNQLPGGQTSGVDSNVGPDGKPLGAGAAIPADRMVYFDYDKSDIRAKDQGLLEEHARYLNANPNATVRLEGHADERGSREYNLALGERRSQAVSRSLKILGVREGQAATFSYGEEKPAMAGHDEGSWQQNRRVEFVYGGQ